jgi:hypothetical protein
MAQKNRIGQFGDKRCIGRKSCFVKIQWNVCRKANYSNWQLNDGHDPSKNSRHRIASKSKLESELMTAICRSDVAKSFFNKQISFHFFSDKRLNFMQKN